MIRVAVVEDDSRYARTIGEYLKKYGERNGVEFQVVYFTNGLDIVEDYSPVYDIIFLDIEMPLMDGMAAAERIRTKDEMVILMFITNLAQYAIRGYGVNALDYVLKPISYEALSLKIFKAINVLNKRDVRSIVLKRNDEVVKIQLTQLEYVEIVNHKLLYHTERGTFHEFRPLKEVEAMLGRGFARCNNCYLVNLKKIKGIKDDSVLIGNDALKISRPKKKEFMGRLAEFYQFGE